MVICIGFIKWQYIYIYNLFPFIFQELPYLKWKGIQTHTWSFQLTMTCQIWTRSCIFSCNTDMQVEQKSACFSPALSLPQNESQGIAMAHCHNFFPRVILSWGRSYFSDHYIMFSFRSTVKSSDCHVEIQSSFVLRTGVRALAALYILICCMQDSLDKQVSVQWLMVIDYKNKQA